MEEPHIENINEGDEQPMEFRSRSKTWPSKEPTMELGCSSSGIDSSSIVSLSSHTPSNSTARLPSINALNPTGTTWSPNSSENFTDPYVVSNDSPSFYSMDAHDTTSNHSLDKEPTTAGGPEKPKRTRRRNTSATHQKKMNPWGEESYADLIIRALDSVQDGRLRLNEIYTWFTENVLYFQNRALPEESAGWKVSKLYQKIILFKWFLYI